VRLLSLPLELTVLLALALASAVWQRHPFTRGRRTLVLLCLSVAAAAFGEWLAVRGLCSEEAGDRIKYLGTLAVTPLWLGFAAQVAGLEIARRVPWFPALVLTPAACAYALLWSPAYGSLFHVTVEHGDDLLGPLWYVVVFYLQAIAVAACAILVLGALRTHDPRRARRAWVLAGVPLAGLLGGALYRSGAISWPYDIHPVLLGAALLLMRESLLGGGLLDTLPFPQRELLRQMPLGLVLTDRGGAVALINHAAARALRVSPSEALGRDVDDLLARLRNTEVEVQSLARGGRASGRLLVFGS
jgi:PAS domain-containing protein